jgi:hypothetical protein
MWYTTKPLPVPTTQCFLISHFIDLNAKYFCEFQSPDFTLGSKAVGHSALGFPSTYLGIIKIRNSITTISSFSSQLSKIIKSMKWTGGAVLMILIVFLLSVGQMFVSSIIYYIFNTNLML